MELSDSDLMLRDDRTQQSWQTVALVALGSTVAVSLLIVQRVGTGKEVLLPAFLAIIGMGAAGFSTYWSNLRPLRGVIAPWPLRYLWVIVGIAGTWLGLAWHESLLAAAAGSLSVRVWCLRALRANRERVDVITEAVKTLSSEEVKEFELERPATVDYPDLLLELDKQKALERARLAQWLGSAVVVCAIAGLVLRGETRVGAIAFTLVAALWASYYPMRRLLSVRSARVSVESGVAPGRAYALLVPSPLKNGVRHILCLWNEPPFASERWGRPDLRLLADDTREDLLSGVRYPAVHEVWVDRSRSCPRWVVGDVGLSLPHRKALTTRVVIESYPVVVPLSMPSPTPVTRHAVLERSQVPLFSGGLGWRAAVLVAAAMLFVVLERL